MSTAKTLRAQHAGATRTALLAVARRLFRDRGYAVTSIDEVADAARVTKGAVYHHFESKRDLFRSVYEELAAEVEARIAKAIARGGGALERAHLAIEEFLACADDPAVRTIMFRDGMAALHGECRVIDERHFLRLLRGLLDELEKEGLLAAADTSVLARLLLAVLIEGSSILGEGPDVDASREKLRSVLQRILAGVLA